MSNRAWVTLATNDSYGLGALVLAHSLRRAGSVYPAVILVTPSVTEAMRSRLSAVFAEVITVDVLDSRDAAHLALLQRPELGITFTKIHCWNLTQYEKCVFLDADTLIVQNCDELFEREELSAAPDVGWPDCFNSGVFVYRPSAETFTRLITFAQERGSFDGGDQGLLNAFFSDWARGDINKHLPFLYNVTSAAFYSYIPALKHYGQNLKIIHFIGAAKPWLQQYNWESRTVDAPEHLREFLQLWWDIFVGQVHSQLETSMSGVAGNLARVVPGAAGYQREALDELTRRQGWEAGNIDYMGADSFDNIWAKISQTLNQPRTSPPKQPSPPRKEPTPPKQPSPPKEVAKPEDVKTSSAQLEISPSETSAPSVAPSSAETVIEKSVAVEPQAIAESPVPVEAPVSTDATSEASTPKTVVDAQVTTDTTVPVEASQTPASVEASVGKDIVPTSETTVASTAEIPVVAETAITAPTEAAPAAVLEATTEISAESTTQAPDAVSETPATIAEAPVTTTDAPAAVTEAPISAIAAPAVTAEAPGVTAEAPVVTAEAPVVATDAPVVAAEDPVVPPETSVVAVEAPIVAAEAPVVAAEPSAVAVDAPLAPVNSEVPKTVEEVLTESAPTIASEAPKEEAKEKTETKVPPTPPVTPKSTPEASTPVTETPPHVDIVSETQSAPTSVEPEAIKVQETAAPTSPTPAAVAPAPEAVKPETTPEKAADSSAITTVSTDSPPLANTPSKEETPVVPAAKSTEEAAQETRL